MNEISCRLYIYEIAFQFENKNSVSKITGLALTDSLKEFKVISEV
mgnify:CR=1 FL=1